MIMFIKERVQYCIKRAMSGISKKKKLSEKCITSNIGVNKKADYNHLSVCTII